MGKARVSRNGKPSTNGKPKTNDKDLKFLSDFQQLTNRLFYGNEVVSRLGLARALGADSKCHDVDAKCDYPKDITFQQYKAMYERDGIATKVVNIFPVESWTVEPWVYETEAMEDDEQTEFEKAWKLLAAQLNIYKVWAQLDEISGIGHYGVLLIGVDDGKELDQPIAGIDENGDYVEGDFPERKINFLMPFDEGHAVVAEWNKDKNSKRFGHPTFYNLTVVDPALSQAGGDGAYHLAPAAGEGKIQKVHWSRVIHVADNCRVSNIFGTPRMKNVFNYLLNIRRILGGSAEMFWNGGFPGTVFEIPSDLLKEREVEFDTDALKDEIEQWYRGFKRYLALKGPVAKQLMPNIADPTTSIDAQIMAVCVAIGVPKRMFTGTEEARLASLQDKDSWNRKIHRRNSMQCTPVIIKPTVDRFIAIRALPKPEEYFVFWPDVYAISETDKADVTGKLVAAVAEYIESGSFKLIPPLEFLTMIMDLTPAEAEKILESAMDAQESSEFDFLEPPEPVMEGGSTGENRKLTRPAGKQKRIMRNELMVNPVMRCMGDGDPGYKYGDSGRCYTYTKGNNSSKRKARRKARLQGIAIEATKRLQAMESQDEDSD